MKIEQKQAIVNEFKERFSQAKVVIVTDYKGLDVVTLNGLRGRLREKAIEYHVVKNTLLRRAAEGNDMALISDCFVGPSAVAYSLDDPVATAKILTEFAKENEALEIKAGVMEGRALDTAAIKALSNLVLPVSLAMEEISMTKEDHREAVAAFQEKREPRFTGN